MKVLSKRPSPCSTERSAVGACPKKGKHLKMLLLLSLSSVAVETVFVGTVALANDRKSPNKSAPRPSAPVEEVASLGFTTVRHPDEASSIDERHSTANFVGSLASSRTVAPRPRLVSIPKLSNPVNGRFFITLGPDKQRALLTPDVGLQAEIQSIVNGVRAPHIAIVALDPKTGKILAIGGKSNSIPDITTHNLFPAASLFKIVTAAASYYTKNTSSNSLVSFRGGNYTLNKYNYLPNAKSDRRKMTVGEAMAKSCNPVFGRLALDLPSAAVLRDFALMFQFGTPLQADFAVPQSEVFIPSDPFNLSRTGAGFGAVTISPIHAAALVAAIGNKGKLPVPQIIEKLVDAEGNSIPFSPRSSKQVIDPELASSLNEMMRQTTKVGTAKSPFASTKKNPGLPFEVIGKTGTLQGKTPKGLTKWFIAAAPASDPQIAIAAVVVDARSRNETPTYLGRRVFDYFFAKRKK
jgi:peptidoglycan glycosyltransferase